MRITNKLVDLPAKVLDDSEELAVEMRDEVSYILNTISPIRNSFDGFAQFATQSAFSVVLTSHDACAGFVVSTSLVNVCMSHTKFFKIVVTRFERECATLLC